MIVKKLPRIDRKTGEQNGWRWDFRSYNKTKRRYEPVQVDAIPKHIRESQDEAIVQAYCQSRSAEEDSIRHRMKLRSEWRKKYQDFEKLMDKFTDYQKNRAPNSWENDVFYLEKYAFHFFLGTKDANNVLNWSAHYQEFIDWLKKVKPLKWNRDRLSLNTQNKIIKALNVFLEMVSRENDKPLKKCPQYSRSQTAQVTASDILEEDEIKEIKKALMDIRQDSHDFFTVLVNTGLRENEAIGMCLSFIFEGNFEGKKLEKIHNQLKVCGLGKYYGYICLESQPALTEIRTPKRFKDRFERTWNAGSVPRKPLKLRKTISPENHRLIPVFNKEAWNIIVNRWNQQLELLDKKSHGKDGRDYLLFDGFTASMFYGDLQKAFEKTKLRFRSPHKFRHTFLTWFYDKTDENRFLAKKVAGHNEERSVLIYSHINEQIGREQAQKAQAQRRMKTVS